MRCWLSEIARTLRGVRVIGRIRRRMCIFVQRQIWLYRWTELLLDGGAFNSTLAFLHWGEFAMRTFEGVRVIDFTQAIAGPFATYQLTLMGADIIKIEQREGRPGAADVPPRRGVAR